MVFISNPPTQCGACGTVGALVCSAERLDVLDDVLVGEARCTVCGVITLYTRRPTKPTPPSRPLPLFDTVRDA